MKIPFAKAYLDKQEEEAVTEVIRSGWLTQGDRVRLFENKFAEYVGARYAVAVNSCTSALFLCLKYFGQEDYFKKNLKVGVPSLTFTASASTILHAGYEPTFIDVNHNTFCMHDVMVEHTLHHEEPWALVTVHLTGNKATTKYGHPVTIIEDSAHRIVRDSQGGNPVCYSFYATKNMTTGEGGMITTNCPEMNRWLRLARMHGSDKDGFNRYKNQGSWEYRIKFPGWKMNMTDIMAAIGEVQLRKLDKMNERRQKIIDHYNKEFNLKRTGIHLYPIRVNERDKFMEHMLDNEIHCSVHFLPLHLMPAYKKYKRNLPVTEKLGKEIVSLPLYPELSDAEVEYVCDTVKKSNLLIEE